MTIFSKPTTIIFIGIFFFAVLSTRIMRTFAFEKWHVSIGLLILGGILYFLNINLIRFFIKARNPEFANDEDWESTAGLGIVPKWVSVIGLLSFSALITAILPWIITFFKNLLR